MTRPHWMNAVPRGRTVPFAIALALVGVVFGPVPLAGGAPATSLDLNSVTDPAVIETVSAATVRAIDSGGATDTTYVGTVTFSANCPPPCFFISPSNLGGSDTSYTFKVADAGQKTFALVWLAQGIGERTLTISGTLPSGGTSTDSVADVTVTGMPTTTTSTTTSTTTTTTVATTTTTTTSTTTTTVPKPRGPGNGAVPIRPENNVQGSPDAAAIKGTERVDVVARRAGSVQWTSQSNAGPWSSWIDLGNPSVGTTGDPTVVSWGPGRLDVFVRGADNKLWQRSTDDGGANWTIWFKTLGDDGVLASGPDASSRGPGRLNLVVVGTDGVLYERFYESGQWNGAWLPHGSPPVAIVGDPTVVSSDSVRVDVFVRGADDKLWQAAWDGLTWSLWGRPVGTDGTLASSPDAASWAPGVLLVFVRGTDGRAYVLPFGGVWGTWLYLAGGGDVLAEGSHPGVTSRGNERFDLFVRGTDSVAYHIWQ